MVEEEEESVWCHNRGGCLGKVEKEENEVDLLDEGLVEKRKNIKVGLRCVE